MELVFPKLLGGELVTTTVKMPPVRPLHLCTAAGLAPVEAPHRQWKWKVPQSVLLPCLATPALIIACNVVTTYIVAMTTNNVQKVQLSSCTCHPKTKVCVTNRATENFLIHDAIHGLS